MKATFVIALTLFSTTLISCKKDYVCTCTTVVTEPSYTYLGITYPGSTNESIAQELYENKKESNAITLCEFNEYTITYSSPNEAQGQGYTTENKTCELSEF